MGKAVVSFADFKIGPPVIIVFGKILFVDELLGDFIESDTHVLKYNKGGAHTEVYYVKTRKFGIESRQHTVNDELDKLE